MRLFGRKVKLMNWTRTRNGGFSLVCVSDYVTRYIHLTSWLICLFVILYMQRKHKHGRKLRLREVAKLTLARAQCVPVRVVWCRLVLSGALTPSGFSTFKSHWFILLLVNPNLFCPTQLHWEPLVNSGADPELTVNHPGHPELGVFIPANLSTVTFVFSWRYKRSR